MQCCLEECCFLRLQCQIILRKHCKHLICICMSLLQLKDSDDSSIFCKRISGTLEQKHVDMRFILIPIFWVDCIVVTTKFIHAWNTLCVIKCIHVTFTDSFLNCKSIYVQPEFKNRIDAHAKVWDFLDILCTKIFSVFRV